MTGFMKEREKQATKSAATKSDSSAVEGEEAGETQSVPVLREVVGVSKRDVDHSVANFQIHEWRAPEELRPTTRTELLDALDVAIHTFAPEKVEHKERPIALSNYEPEFKFRVIAAAAKITGRLVPDNVLTRITSVEELVDYYTKPAEPKPKNLYEVLSAMEFESGNVTIEPRKPRRSHGDA
ncbi:hypothetical protein YB2330_001373 [Saitoella coloradoensis]